MPRSPRRRKAEHVARGDPQGEGREDMTTTHPLPARRWHHPQVHHRTAGWSWECRCGAAGRSIPVARPWRAIVVEALRHADLSIG